MTQVADSMYPQNLSALKSHGFVGVVRYASDAGNPKNATRAEFASTIAAGLTFTLVCEQGNQPAMRGTLGGMHDGAVAEKLADALGYDPGATIYYVAEDPNVLSPSAWPTVEAYFRGVPWGGNRPVGAYGSERLVAHLMSLGLATKGWVVSTWGGASPWPGMHLAQMVGANTFAMSIDADAVLQGDYGQHPRPGGGGPTPSPGRATGENVLTTDPNTGGGWALQPDGGVDTSDGSPILGSLAGNRFNWAAVGTLAGIAAWRNPADQQWGYKIAVQLHTGTAADGGIFDYYRFPRDGRMKAVGAARFEESDDSS